MHKKNHFTITADYKNMLNALITMHTNHVHAHTTNIKQTYMHYS